MSEIEELIAEGIEAEEAIQKLQREVLRLQEFAGEVVTELSVITGLRVSAMDSGSRAMEICKQAQNAASVLVAKAQALLPPSVEVEPEHIEPAVIDETI